jgi:hypothetical protein
LPDTSNDQWLQQMPWLAWFPPSKVWGMAQTHRLPNLPITQIPMNVQPKLMAPRMICVMNESWIPTDWKIVAP